jgi:hypothetical protein
MEIPMPRRRATKIEIAFASEADAYAAIVGARAELLGLIAKGYGSHGARETMAACRERVQALADAHPLLWERACTQEA